MDFSPSLPALEVREASSWKRLGIDTLLGSMGALLITGFIYLFQLYPRIPNISIVYLLAVLALASTRGRYAAIIASLVAFLSFDFFLVPPLYVFTIYRVEEWIALVVFLLAALLTGQLAFRLRQQANDAQRRARENRVLYELARLTATVEPLEQQLATLVQALVTVFSPWGVRASALLLPDASGILTIQAYFPATESNRAISSDDRAAAEQVMKTGRSMGMHATGVTYHTSIGAVSRITILHSPSQKLPHLRFVPLKAGTRVIGVLRLLIQQGPLSLAEEEHMTEDQERKDQRTAFFWTVLDQATSMIELARLRRESLRMEVLQRTDILRAALLSSVSHDLRTPLTSIKAAASSLQQRDVDWDEEARRSFAAAIEREADHLNRLVGNLLDMTRIEGGALKQEMEWYSLPELVQDVLERMQPLLKDRPIHTTLPDDLPLILFDYVQMDQVVTNVLENAVRYTPSGSPIDISVQQQGTWQRLEISDRGPGIPPQDLERIFDKFYRVQARQHTSTPGGTGLGLAVSKGIIEAHGGHIRAQVRDGGGTTFVIELPVKATSIGVHQ